ncbi:hypothetical protein Syun_023076 [Stephania yunnanensis]|uniref:Uncharacterized protein n=1 Tax=Stephania yunnanensis TaxID=152371 RepID=A0AAP0F883_9MAGN
MVKVHVPLAESSYISTKRAKRKGFYKSLFSAFQRNEKQILRNKKMLEENEQTLNHFMSERRMKCLLDPIRIIDVPSMQTRLLSRVFNPTDNYTSQPTATRNDEEVEESDEEFTSAESTL